MVNDISVRRMTEDDVPVADELRRLAGWNQTLEDWRRLLQLEPHGCFIALQAGDAVGTVTTTTYGQALAWIGMMLVHPDHRRRGIGTRLMRQSLDYLHSRGVDLVRLDATPAGYPLYEKLGFVSEWTLTRCQRTPAEETVFPKDTGEKTRDLGNTDWRAVDEIDAAAFGVSRSRLIRSLVQHSRAALVWPAQGEVVGWGMLRPGAGADYLGPLVCSDSEGSLALVRALLQRAGSRSVIWDMPDRNKAAQTVAHMFGFAPLRPLTRMRQGPSSVASDPQAQFAIADPAVG